MTTWTGQTLALVGGSGTLGTGLALRWAAAGHRVLIGSRTAETAEAAVARLRTRLAQRGCHAPQLAALDNLAAAREADIVVLTVPFAHHAATLEALRPALSGKLLVDTTVPLVPPQVGTAVLPPGGSAGAQAQQWLGDAVSVVSAFQNVPAAHLQSDHPVDCDVLVCGNRKEDRERVISLVRDAGLRGFHAGPIANAVAVEALTPVIIQINRAFKCQAGIRITGVPQTDPDGAPDRP